MVNAIDEDLSLLGVIEPGNQVEQRGLSAAGGADNGDSLAFFSCKANILYSRFIGIFIGKGHIPELQTAPNLTAVGDSAALNGSIAVQDGIDTPGQRLRLWESG